MRGNRKLQLPLLPNPAGHPHAGELEAVSQILDENPVLAELATEDLLGRKVNPAWGAPGMSGGRVLRRFIIKSKNRFS